MSQPLNDVSLKYEAYSNIDVGTRLYLARAREQFLRQQLRSTYAELNTLRQQLSSTSQEIMQLQDVAGEYETQ